MGVISMDSDEMDRATQDGIGPERDNRARVHVSAPIGAKPIGSRPMGARVIVRGSLGWGSLGPSSHSTHNQAW